MSKKLNISLYARILASFIVLSVTVIAILAMGYLVAKKLANGEVEDVASYMRKYQTNCALVFVFITVVITTAMVFIKKLFKTRFKEVTEAAETIATGKLIDEINNPYNDEFGILVDSINGVITNSRNQAAVMEQVADGNLTVEVNPASEGDVLGRAIEKMVGQNRHALLNISESAGQVLTSSSEVASASEALAQGSTEQASAIEEITVSMSDIADKTKQNAAEATTTADYMKDVISSMNRGKDQMIEMTEAMNEINKSSESISKIIKVIDDIAFQTNILALNAAVEAARAGEAGKGFAVVAEEVRNLAAKSAEAASETAELIEDSIRKVNAGSEISKQLSTEMMESSRMVDDCGQKVIGIAEASNYQATAIEQVNSAIEQVSEVVSTNSATSEECAAASVELSNQAKKMKELLSIYKLGGRDDYVNEVYTPSIENERIISLGDGFGKY
ncbi:MAG: methyl-accepting chemotaxis protein [Acetatifactor sp.]|nr:methyl-accepting chemotaxis protein [Acetatifactor sp.]